MWAEFQSEYLDDGDLARGAHDLHTSTTKDGGKTTVVATVLADGREIEVDGVGEGPVEAFVNALARELAIELDIVDYTEHAIGSGASARAVAYVEAVTGSTGPRWGIGVDGNITTASLKAVLGAVRRLTGIAEA